MSEPFQQCRERFIEVYHRRLKEYAKEFLEVPNRREAVLERFDEDWPTIRRAWEIAQAELVRSRAGRAMLINAAVEAFNLLEARLTYGELRDWLSAGLGACQLAGFDAGRWLYHSLLGRQEQVFGSMEAAKRHFQAAEAIDGRPVHLLNSTARFDDVANRCASPEEMLIRIEQIAATPKTAHTDLLRRVGVHEVCSELRDHQRAPEALALSVLAYKRASRAGDEIGRGHLILETGLAARHLGSYRRAQLCFTWQRTVARRVGDRKLELSAEKELAATLLDSGQYESSEVYALSTLRISEALGDDIGKAEALFHLSQLYVHNEDFAKAQSFAEEALRLFRQRALRSGVTSCLMILILCALHVQQRAHAASLLKELEEHLTSNDDVRSNGSASEGRGFLEWAQAVLGADSSSISVGP